MMKKITWCLVLGIVAMLGLVSCNDENDVTDKRVAVCLPDAQSLVRWANDLKFIEDAMRQYGLDTKTYLVPETQAGAHEQVEQIQQIIADGIKTLVITPVDYKVLNDAKVFEGHDDLNIICHDRLIFQNDKITCYSSCKREQVGVMQAQYLLEYFQASGASSMTLEMFGGPVDDDNARYYFEGAYGLLEPYISDGRLTVKSGLTRYEDARLDVWTEQDAYTKFKARLQKSYKGGECPDLILCPNDLSAFGVIKALDECCPGARPIITGQDNSERAQQYIREGRMAMTIDKSIKDMAYNTAAAASSLVNGVKPVAPLTINNGAIDVPLMVCPLTLISAENLK